MEKEAIASYQVRLEINHLQQTLNQLQKEKQEAMGLVELHPTSSTASVSEKSSPSCFQPDKGKEEGVKADCQILMTSDVSDTLDGELSDGDISGDSDTGKAKKKKGKKKLKSGMTVKAKDASIKVKVKWAQSMLGTKKEINFDDMDLNQFVFGESRLINRNKIDLKEKETRIHLMQRI